MQSLRRPRPHALGLFGLFLLLSAFVVIGRVVPWDESLLRTANAWRTPALTDWMLGFTFLGNALIEVPAAFMIAWILWRTGRGSQANRYLIAVIAGELFYVILKVLFRRPRPTIVERLGEAGWYSYPSGHTMLAPILWSFGLLLLATAVRNRMLKVVLGVAAVVIPVLLAVSRVYLGVHYPSDVLGALLVGSAWVVWWWPRSPGEASAASTSSTPAIK